MNKSLLLIFSVILLLVFLGCSSQKLAPGSEIQLAGKDKPEWIYDPISQDKSDLKAFAGVSHDFKMENDARADALKDARQQIIDFMGVLGKRIIKEAIVTSGLSSDIINPAVATKQESEMLSESYIQTRAKNFHIERWQRVNMDNSVENYYKAYVLVLFDEKDTQKYLQEALSQAKKTAENEEQQKLISRAEDLLNSKSLFDK